MSLRTVKVPAEMAPLFEQAEAVVSEYFANRRDAPENGTIEIFGERYLLVRAASLSVEFFTLARDLMGDGKHREADEFSRNILFDLAHAIGKSDARNFHSKMELEDPIARLSAGPVHFSHTGWAFVDISPDSTPAKGDEYYLLYDHPYSFESDAWRDKDVISEFPVCIMNAGYSSGWCEESFGTTLMASEILCRARGDDTCRFIMAPPDRIEQRIQNYIESKPELAPRLTNYQIPDFFVRKRLEDSLRLAKQDLEVRVQQRTEELNKANEQLKEEIAARAEVERQLLQSQKLEALGRLAGGVAHDFNNLLTTIGGYSEMLLGELPSDSPLTQYALEIVRGTERAADLTKQLLVFSHHQAPEPCVVELGVVARRMARMLQRLIGDNIELHTRASDQDCCIRLDLGRLEQVIVNLAVNARDAMPDGGRLDFEVEVDEPRDEVLLRIRDTGSGMDEETLIRVFDPFFTTKAIGKGTGLGLATVYSIVHQSGGTITVTSSPGHGATFEVRFPRVYEAVEPIEEDLEVMGELNHDRGVLLVEDEDSVRDLLRLQLEGLGFEVYEAHHADEALKLYRQHGERIDILLTDVIMPGKSGVELARELQSQPQSHNLKTVFISGYTNAIDVIEATGLPESVETFIQKPFTLAVLKAKLHELLE